MASKLTPQQKAADSTIRAFNAQIERAYKTLGANNTVTINLVNTAKSLYGASGMREMKIKPHGVVGAMVNPATGEAAPIPQITRTKENLNNAYKAKELKGRTQYTTGSRKGQYKNMFDVTRAHQKAIKQVRQNIVKAMTPQYRRSHTPKEIQKEVNRQMTNEMIRTQQLENDLASEIFAKYAKARQNDDDEFEYYQRLANEYHNNNRQIPDTDLWQMAVARSDVFSAKEILKDNSLSVGENVLNAMLGNEIDNPF